MCYYFMMQSKCFEMDLAEMTSSDIVRHGLLPLLQSSHKNALSKAEGILMSDFAAILKFLLSRYPGGIHFSCNGWAACELCQIV